MNVAADEKTEKATPKRRQDERKKGNVFQSNDVIAVCSLLVLFNSLNALAPKIYRTLKTAMELFFSYAASTTPLAADDLPDKLLKAVLLFGQAAFPLLFIGVAVAVVTTFFQTHVFVINIQSKILLGILLMMLFARPIGAFIDSYYGMMMSEVQKVMMMFAS